MKNNLLMVCAHCSWRNCIEIPKIIPNKDKHYDPIVFEWVCEGCEKELGLKIQPRK